MTTATGDGSSPALPDLDWQVDAKRALRCCLIGVLLVISFLHFVFDLYTCSDWFAERLHKPLSYPGYLVGAILLGGTLCGLSLLGAVVLLGQCVTTICTTPKPANEGGSPFCFLLIIPVMEFFALSDICFDAVGMRMGPLLTAFFSIFYFMFFAAAANRSIPRDYWGAFKRWLHFTFCKIGGFGGLVLCRYFLWMPQMQDYPDYDYKGPMYLSNITGARPGGILSSGSVKVGNDSVTLQAPPASDYQFLEVSWGGLWACPNDPQARCSSSFDYEPFGNYLKFTSYTHEIFKGFLAAYNITSTDSVGKPFVPYGAMEAPHNTTFPFQGPQPNQNVLIQGNCKTCNLPGISTGEAESVLSAALYAFFFALILWGLSEVAFWWCKREKEEKHEFELVEQSEDERATVSVSMSKHQEP